MSDNLLPCPMCGSPARLLAGESGGYMHMLNAEPPDRYALVVCEDKEGCGVRGKTCGESFDSDPETDAIAAWNRRTGIAGMVPEGAQLLSVVTVDSKWQALVVCANDRTQSVRDVFGTGPTIEEAVADASNKAQSK